jgi:hypothetical protein
MTISLGGLFRDPDGSVSSTRISGVLCVVVGCGVAVAGMILNREQAGTVAGLLGGGAAAFFTRKVSGGTP